MNLHDVIIFTAGFLFGSLPTGLVSIGRTGIHLHKLNEPTDAAPNEQNAVTHRVIRGWQEPAVKGFLRGDR